MQLFFRELSIEDIPHILEISKDIWEGDDYIPYVIQRWLEEKDCMNYGTFVDEEKKDLIGFGRVKFFPNGVAWLEGGRVKVSYQKKGVGREQLRYAIDYAQESGANFAQYDTSSKNVGSLALAKHFDFKEKKRMELLTARANEVSLQESEFLEVQQIQVEEAKEIYKKMNIGPGTEVCIGWSYIPLESILDKNSVWFWNKKAILQKIRITSTIDQESPNEDEIWIIVYGEDGAAFNLAHYAIKEELINLDITRFELFCNPGLVNKLKELGFSYQDNEPFGVVLLEKEL